MAAPKVTSAVRNPIAGNYEYEVAAPKKKLKKKSNKTTLAGTLLGSALILGQVAKVIVPESGGIIDAVAQGVAGLAGLFGFVSAADDSKED